MAGSHDLDTGLVTIGHRQIGGKGQLGDAECAVSSCVDQRWGEGVVEDGDVLAEPEVDEDVCPRVVQLQLETAAIQGPLGSVAVGEVAGDASTGPHPLGVLLVVSAESVDAPFWVREAEVGSGKLRRGEDGDGLHLGCCCCGGGVALFCIMCDGRSKN